MGVSAVILVAHDIRDGEEMQDFTKRSAELTYVELVLWVYISTTATETPKKYPFVGERSSLLLSLPESFYLSLNA